MIIKKTGLDGVVILEPRVLEDNRGWFMESWSDEWLSLINNNKPFVQDNHSYSAYKGTLRGLHYQKQPKAQAKLVRCVRGSVMDVAVDIRKESPTYLKWVATELSAENKRMFYIPEGFAHGFLTLEDQVEIQYKVNEDYSSAHDAGFAWNDPSVNINWGVNSPILSDKDKNAEFLIYCEHDFDYLV